MSPRTPSTEIDEAAIQQPNKKPRKESTTFLSFPREIRQQIFTYATKPAYLGILYEERSFIDLKSKVNALNSGLPVLADDIEYATKEWAKEMVRMEAKKQAIDLEVGIVWHICYNEELERCEQAIRE